MHINSSLPINPNDLIKSGKKLFGEELSKSELKIWFQQEENAFYETGSDSAVIDPWYAYIRYVNKRLGYKVIADLLHQPAEVIALGPGDGAEFGDLLKSFKIKRIHCIEASKEFQKILKRNFQNTVIIEPRYTGDIDMPNNSANLFLAYSVLHHIPNVGKVMAEIGRVTQKNGILIIREPCSSMGMWGTNRSATPNERGISKNLMVNIATDNGFTLLTKPVPILYQSINKLIVKKICRMNNSILYLLDRTISKIVSLNDHYWRDTLVKKIGPSSYFYIFKKY